jgi:TonB family protein
VVRCIFVIFAGVVALLPLTPQTPTEALPSVSISLPPNVPSEKVQISYFLIGPFGGYGTYAPQRAGVHSYEIPTTVGNKAATEVRVIIYAPGCEIQTFVIPLLEDARVRQEFPCQPLATVHLSGQIEPNELVHDTNAELVVTYMAYWAHKFYRMTDGIVTEFPVATVSLDANGMFQVELPYFGVDAAASSSQGRASFRLMLRDSKTWNQIASNLEPDMPELVDAGHNLQIWSHYPEGLKFETPKQEKVGNQTEQPKLIYSPLAPYPGEAGKEGIQGKVTLSIVIDAKGNVSEARELSGPEELVPESLAFVRQWRYEPPITAPLRRTVEVSYGSRDCPGAISESGELTWSWRLSNKNGETVAVIDGDDGSPPPYPVEERRAGAAGKMVLSVILHPNGRVREIHAIHSVSPGLDKAVIDMVRELKFKRCSVERLCSENPDASLEDLRLEFVFQATCNF